MSGQSHLLAVAIVGGVASTSYVRTSICRRRANHSRATIASTNGVSVRYSVIDAERGQARLHEADDEARGERDRQRLELADERGGQRGDHEEA